MLKLSILGVDFDFNHIVKNTASHVDRIMAVAGQQGKIPKYPLFSSPGIQTTRQTFTFHEFDLGFETANLTRELINAGGTS